VLIFFVSFVGFIVSFRGDRLRASSRISCLRGCDSVHFAVAGTPTATARGARDARRLKAITEAHSASAALP
jgi:hypothetical protein